MEKNITLLLALFAALFTYSVQAQEKPDWVIGYGGGQRPGGLDTCYVGIGESPVSFEESDKIARVAFAKNVSVVVKSELVKQTKESGAGIAETTEQSTSEETELSLRGIPGPAHYQDALSGKYFSRIMIGKVRYNILVAEEITLDLERRKRESSGRMEKDSILVAEKAEEIKRTATDRRLDEQASKETMQMDREHRELMKQRYANFLVLPFPYKLITTHTAAFPQGSSTFSLGAGLIPFSLMDVGYMFTTWHIAFGTSMKFTDSKLDAPEFFAGYQVLPPMGEIEKVSAVVGVVYSKSGLITQRVKDAPEVVSPYIDVTMSLPQVLCSYVSAHADYRKYSIGAASYPFFDSWSNTWGVVMELTYVADAGYRNKYEDHILIEAGIQFRPTASTMTTIAFRNHDTVSLIAEFCF